MSKLKRKSVLLLTLLIAVAIVATFFIINTKDDNASDIFLTEEEKAWLDEHKDEIRIGHTIDYPPVEFSSNGKYVGISADYFKLLERKLGIAIEMVEFDNFDDLITQVQNRELTGITAATKTPERSKYLDFTIPYIDNPNVIITRKNFSENLTFEKLANTSMDIIVIEGYDIIEFLNERFPKLEYRTVKSPSDGMRMVAFGEADAMIIEIMSANAEIERDNISNLMVNVETPYESNLSIATRNDWPILNQIFNKGLSQITDYERKVIEEKWMPLRQKGMLQNKYFWVAILAFVLVLIVIIIVISMWNSSLQLAVREKTGALEESKKKLMFKTYHDELTGLYNRVYMSELLQQYEKESPMPFSIIVADLNGLKITNDTFGHNIGDQLLIKVSNIIKENIQPHHIACRIGGDEIVVFMPYTIERTCVNIVNAIRDATFAADEDPIKPLVALGYATSNNEHYDYTTLFKLAEDKMYANKMDNSEINYGMIISSIKNNLNKNKYENEEHHERLAAMAKEVGNALGLEKSIIENLILLADLHDIGKVGIDEEILMKSGPLTPDEWKSVRRLPELGFKIVSGSTRLSHIGKSILALRERWDGMGYPQGLKGEEIPYTSRLFSIIEAFDVMTHERSYKPVMSAEQALKEIENNSGSQFDPELVNLFKSLPSSIYEGYSHLDQN
ncbi:MAG: transporter substrate-binding domain-containing protein [Tissierellaceae bacterium]|nr:transporter substrate-binding domain-containing protein [Tissierellaceae bacterium]